MTLRDGVNRYVYTMSNITKPPVVHDEDVPYLDHHKVRQTKYLLLLTTILELPLPSLERFIKSKETCFAVFLA